MPTVSVEKMDSFIKKIPTKGNSDEFAVKKINIQPTDSEKFVDDFEVVGRGESGEVFVLVVRNQSSWLGARFGLDVIGQKLNSSDITLRPQDFLIRNLERTGILPVQQLWARLELWKELNPDFEFPENPFDDSIQDHLTAHATRAVMTGWTN